MAIETKRGYITKADVESYANISVTDDDEAIEYMELAEEVIDNYVGFQNRFMRYSVEGIATGGSTTTLVDTSSDSYLNDSLDGVYEYCTIKIIAGTNIGEERIISTHNKDTGTITVNTAFTSAIDTTSVYIVYQLGKFPREKDVRIIDDRYYKYIPNEVKSACLAQMEYIIEMGTDFFISGVDKKSEDIDGYSYEANDITRMIAPKARHLLIGIMNRKGNLII